jgi:hypothetical protein
MERLAELTEHSDFLLHIGNKLSPILAPNIWRHHCRNCYAISKIWTAIAESRNYRHYGV